MNQTGDLLPKLLTGMTPVLAPVASFAVVIVLVVFILLERETRPRWILLSAIEARSALALGKMARSIKMALPETVILIGLWSLPPQGGARVIRKITESSVGGVYTSIERAVRGVASLVSTTFEETHSDEIDDGLTRKNRPV